MLINLIYHSLAVDHINDQDIVDILEEARAFNEENEISGLLLFHRGEFVPILEGEDKNVNGIFAKIKADPRHRLVRLLETSPISNRTFPNWHMAFKPLSDKNLTDFSSHLHLEDFHHLSKVQEDTPLANKLLRIIGDMMLNEGPQV